MNLSSPRYSIVIPTRRGAETLGATLRSCLNLKYDDYEVVVCDNDTSSATKDLIKRIASSKIKYFRAPRPLAMSSNWEFAVSQATGDYVTVLGDDDALLSHAFTDLDRILEQTNSPIVTWEAALYLWPTITLPGDANYLRLPIRRAVRTLNGASVIRSVIAFESPYTALPMLYNSIVSRELLSSVKDRTGRLFMSQSPDICSGFLLAYCTKSYTYVESPMSVSGLSRQSTGVNRHFLSGTSSINEDFEKLNFIERRNAHAMIPDVAVFPTVPVVDSFLAVKESVFPSDSFFSVDRKTMIRHCVWCLKTDDEEEWNSCMRAIRSSLEDNPELQRWFDAELADHSPRMGPHRLRSSCLGADDRYVHLDAGRFSITDVAEAAALCERILGYTGKAVAGNVGSRDNGVGAAPVGESSIERELLAQMLVGASYQAREIQRLKEEAEIIPELRQSLDHYQRAWRYPRAVYRLTLRVYQMAGMLLGRKRSP